ncbi:caspase, EACC1-associated type [Glycomyces terrestris]|uniref:Cell wall synthesis protein Wag31 n=1 Tax=Glycomyces terrestris TaxID=2493553 RepID=A0A426V0U5_9ACTN|nr:DivIVA domain-containing protein [Glycomyces terrestris]RRS00466.1 DivIVA domain-containing protein [Glycomyces terrestris]
MRLPDGARSRALLLGTAAYDHLAPVPAAVNNVEAMREALVRRTGIPAAHCEALTNANDLTEVGAAVERAAQGAKDLLLVYFSGHGLVDDTGMLHLALPQTSQGLLPWSGVPFAFLHRAIQTARAEAKVIVLDCCFSGIATQVLADAESLILGQIRVSGHVTLTSSPANSPSYAFEGKRHTAFTQAFLDVLKHGSRRAGALLTLDDVFLELERLAVERDLPRPQKCVTHTADKLALAENRYQVARGSGPIDDHASRLGSRPATEEPEPPVVPAPPDQALISAGAVRDVRFKTVRLTEGYDEDEVDAFLDQVALALLEPAEGPQRLSAEEVRASLFTTTRLREGYDMEEVDSFLDLIESEFERRQAITAPETGKA